jgi:polyribonucleotide nucleotidyltransferase
MEEQEGSKRFMHHYNFPPFSSGETGRMGGTNRRMIGHGALAEKALSYIIPDKDSFPYTIRIVSESMASNGSTSMASVCGSTLALMDAGVPIKAPVAGIAMGLMSDPSDMSHYKVLTDIQGPEDHHGDMDFKVAGTTQGITAIQMDVKVDGIPVPILVEALEGAKSARLRILDVITQAISAPRASLPESAPSIIRMKVLEDQIGQIIGPSGKTIKKIRLDSGVEEIDIEDDGTIFITGKNGTAQRAQQIIHDMTREYLPGERFEGTVIKLFEFGALVKINAFTEGLVHVSELAPFRIANVADIVKEGDVIPVVVKESDDPNKLRLSLRQADPDYATRKGVQPASAPTTGERPHGRNTDGHGPRYGGMSPEEHRRRFGGR